MRGGLPPDVAAAAQTLLDMVGLLLSPAVAADYQTLGIAYDGVEQRKEAWGIAETALATYEEHASPNQLKTVCNICSATGHFSIWMEVFQHHPGVRLALIKTCKASTISFDTVTSIPRKRGRS